MAKQKAQAYEVVAVTLDYWAAGKQVRRRAGETVADLPANSIPWLLAKGSIKVAAQPAGEA